MPKKHDDLEWLEPWMELENMAELADIPREWLICPMCAEFSWRFPPHGFRPCPIAVGMAEAAGMKMDAERMTAVRAGVQFEEMSRTMRQYIEEHGLRLEEDDDNDE